MSLDTCFVLVVSFPPSVVTLLDGSYVEWIQVVSTHVTAWIARSGSIQIVFFGK